MTTLAAPSPVAVAAGHLKVRRFQPQLVGCLSKGPRSYAQRLIFEAVQAIEGHLAQQVATAIANLDHLKEHKHLILKSQGGSHLQGAGSPLAARHNKVRSDRRYLQ